jgi:hypothetical protein
MGSGAFSSDDCSIVVVRGFSATTVAVGPEILAVVVATTSGGHGGPTGAAGATGATGTGTRLTTGAGAIGAAATVGLRLETRRPMIACNRASRVSGVDEVMATTGAATGAGAS